MDDALRLKIAYDNGVLSEEIIDQYLKNSSLVDKLCSEFSSKSLYPIWRLLALSEIPYTIRLKYTQELVSYTMKHYATLDGFSITGKSEDILPCYNGMLLEAFSKMGIKNDATMRAVEWIKKYQVFDRTSKTSWAGVGIKKYGGCMNKVPCYIGIVKALKGLIYYQKLNNDSSVQDLIDIGIEYILEHQLIFRLSNQEPITKHIRNIAFPQSYQLNVIELLEIMYITNNMNDDRVQKVKDYLSSKLHKDNYYKINYVYKADGYISFDNRGEKGEWVTYLINKYLSS